MKGKQIPKSLIVFGIVLVLFLVFLFTILMPTISNYPTYESKHTAAVAQIAKLDDTIANQKSIEEKIDSMTKEFDEKQSDLFVTAETSVDDLQSILQKYNLTASTFSGSDGVVDTKGRVSSSGVPMYTVTINFTFDSNMADALNVIHYMEQESKGCYFINTATVTPKEKGTDYTIAISTTLYYFNTDAEVATEAATQAATTA